MESSSNRGGLSNANDDFSNPLQQKLGGYFQSLSKEIERTVQFADRTYRTMTPSQIMLMGAGVRIPTMDQTVEYRVGIPTHTWALDVAENLFGNQHLGVYAIAAGLSCLAWEAM